MAGGLRNIELVAAGALRHQFDGGGRTVPRVEHSGEVIKRDRILLHRTLQFSRTCWTQMRVGCHGHEDSDFIEIHSTANEVGQVER